MSSSTRHRGVKGNGSEKLPHAWFGKETHIQPQQSVKASSLCLPYRKMITAWKKLQFKPGRIQVKQKKKSHAYLEYNIGYHKVRQIWFNVHYITQKTNDA